MLKSIPSSGARLDPDLIEKFLVATFMTVLAARLIPAVLSTGALPPLLLLMSEGLVVLFILLRRPTRDISQRGYDWVIGLTGTLLPLLAVAPRGTSLLPHQLCELIIAGGLLFHLWAKLTLRRSFGVVAANRGIKANGPYRIVRHPMYAGYVVTHIGFVLAGPVLWNLAIYGATLLIQTRRILAEERMLMQDPAYRALAERVRYRLLPRVF
ncbi:MAG TPA: isoprenylcysteine carboxylmethyltransferase family protein [Allosphingosinicella sp.]|jgi:protein-S-isoprenylcysteine O-methyltransferase Ste14|nr:isoprenylcysteine carboxylmethyltransferase family protein [Allosphingosinicella sp.]